MPIHSRSKYSGASSRWGNVQPRGGRREDLGTDARAGVEGDLVVPVENGAAATSAIPGARLRIHPVCYQFAVESACTNSTWKRITSWRIAGDDSPTVVRSTPKRTAIGESLRQTLAGSTCGSKNS